MIPNLCVGAETQGRLSDLGVMPKPAAVKARYARPSHRLGRRAWAYAVATGLVRCFRGRACKWAEWVDGELVGGIIRGAWDLGHPDPENPTGGPEHRACNRGAPSRLAAMARRAS